MGRMLNFLSLFIGIVAAGMAMFAFIPFLGWGNWFIVPLAIVGLILGALSRSTAGRTLNLIVIVICVVRLTLGNGLI
jgi:hypothetical protein